MEPSSVRVTSEIGPLRDVICHTPGRELLAVTPSTRKSFLYDDIIDLKLARREHRQFTSLLSRFATVHQTRDLLLDIIDDPEVRRFLVERVANVPHSEGLAEELLEVPAPELIATFIEGREEKAGPLQKLMNVASYQLPPLPNLFFTRDTAMAVDDGILIGSMKHRARWTEEVLMKALFRHHPKLRNRGLVYDGTQERRSAHSIEGGDVHILRPDLVVLGLSERSSPGAFDALVEQLVERQGIRDIIIVILPTQRAFIHLDMLFTMVDREHCVVFPPAFRGPARLRVLHFRAGRSGVREMPDLFAALQEVDLPLTPVLCGGESRVVQEREQWSSGCNFVAVRPGVILGYARNEATYRQLEREAGYRIIEGLDLITGEDTVDEGEKAAILFEGSELVRGGGGPRCMTMPVRRDDIW